MAKKVYIGVNDLSKKVKSLYVGVDGLAKKVKKMYIGVDGLAKECYSFGIDPSKTSYTELEFIDVCQAGLQSQLPIGAIITLSNTEQSTWEVIGVNHDGTQNTVDIMSHTNTHSANFASSSQYYSGSNLQKYCNETIPNAFTNATVKSLIKTMDVASNNTTLTGQKGKALSCTELGYSDLFALSEGTSYGLTSYGFRSGVSYCIWTRSRDTGISNRVWCVGSSGMDYGTYNASSGALPVLRF